MSAGAQTLSYKPFYLRIRLPDGQTKNIHDLDPYSTLDELMLAVSVSFLSIYLLFCQDCSLLQLNFSVKSY